MKRAPATLLRIRNRELKAARQLIARLQASPHFRLSELLASAERMKTARLGETAHFTRPLSFFAGRPSLDPVCLTETGYLVTKDVP